MHKKTQTVYSLIIIIIFMALFKPVSAQRRIKPGWGYGASIIYNFGADGWGAGLRVKIPIRNRLSAVPEVSYFPSFNRYHELYAGVALHYEILTIKSYNLYLAAGGYYNNWINAEVYAPGLKKKNNFAPEAGGGLVRNRGCWRPFIEDRYDFKWKENTLRIGIYWYPGSCNKNEKCPPKPS